MKIITKIIIRMSDWEVLSRKDYEYEGPIAECGGGGKRGGGGGGTSTQYVQSPEARKILQAFMPTLERIGAMGAEGGDQSMWPVGGYDIPEYGASPGYDIPDYNLPDYNLPGLYDVPDTTKMMPTEATMAGISPEVKAGVMAPYKETEKQLLETLGAGGGLGSARGGFSGQGASGVGRYWGDVAPEYTKSLWDMVSPAQQAGWQAELGRARTGYGAELGRERELFGAGLGRERDIWGAGLGRGRDIWGADVARQHTLFGAGVDREKDIWQQELQSRQFPYTIIPGMAGQAMPSPVVTTQGSGKK